MRARDGAFHAVVRDQLHAAAPLSDGWLVVLIVLNAGTQTGILVVLDASVVVVQRDLAQALVHVHPLVLDLLLVQAVVIWQVWVVLHLGVLVLVVGQHDLRLVVVLVDASMGQSVDLGQMLAVWNQDGLVQ